MGKGCVRFKKLDDLPLDVIARTVARVSVEEHIANYRAARALLTKSTCTLNQGVVYQMWSNRSTLGTTIVQN